MAWGSTARRITTARFAALAYDMSPSEFRLMAQLGRGGYRRARGSCAPFSLRGHPAALDRPRHELAVCRDQSARYARTGKPP